jgi:hypothetical protein
MRQPEDQPTLSVEWVFVFLVSSKDGQSFGIRDYAHNHSRRCSAPESRLG